MDDSNITNQTNENTNVEQPVNTTMPVDNTQVTNDSTTTPVDSQVPDNTPPETTNAEPTTDNNSTITPVDNTTTPSSGDSTSVEKPATNDNGGNATTIPTTPIEIPNYIEVYDYDLNGYYIGVDIADRSPLDKEVVYLLPANSTKEKPPIVMDSKIPKWNGESWDIVDKPKDVIIKEETSKKTDEVIGDLLNKIIDLEIKVSESEKKVNDLEAENEKLVAKVEEQQIKIDEYEKRILALEQLVSGIIATNINIG